MNNVRIRIDSVESLLNLYPSLFYNLSGRRSKTGRGAFNVIDRSIMHQVEELIGAK